MGSGDSNALRNLNTELRNKCNKLEIKSSIQGPDAITELIVLGNEILEIIEKKKSILDQSSRSLLDKIKLSKFRESRKIKSMRSNLLLLLSAANVIAAEYSV